MANPTAAPCQSPRWYRAAWEHRSKQQHLDGPLEAFTPIPGIAASKYYYLE